VLRGKTILAVDDEPDVLETIIEVLDMCLIETAGTFNKAQQLLETNEYDIVILDVMGVKGLHLLDLAVKRHFTAVMLTAPALTPDYILRSMSRGAVSYISKEELACLDTLLGELLELMAAGQSPWQHTLRRLEPLLDERLPPGWQQKYGNPWDRR
jgi:CheY-like chemotaxis protein